MSESPELLQGAPGTQTLRRRLLEKARDYWLEQASQQQTSRSKRELAAANLRLGDVLNAIDEYDTATQRFSVARDLFQELRSRDMKDQVSILGLVQALGRLGVMYRLVGDERAEASMREAVEATRHLNAIVPTTPELKLELAQVLIQQEKYQESQSILKSCEQDLRKLLADDPTAELNRQLARVFLARGMSADKVGDAAASLDWPQQAVALLQPIVESSESTPHDIISLADAHNNCAAAASRHHNHPLSEEHYLQAISLLRRLSDENPVVGFYRNGLASTLQNLADAYRKANRFSKSAETIQEAFGLFEKLIQDHPENVHYLADYGMAADQFATSARDAGQLDVAKSRYEKAIELRTKVHELLPDAPEHHNNLAGSYSNLGIVLHYMGDVADAEAKFDQALQIRQQLVDDFPQSLDHKRDLSDSYNNLGYLSLEMGDYSRAVEMNQKAIKLREELCTLDPANGELRRLKTLSLQRLASAQRFNRQLEDALKTFDAAVLEQRAAVKQFPTDRRFRTDLMESLAQMGDLLLMELNRYSDSIECFSEGLAMAEEIQGKESTYLDFAESAASMRQAIGLALVRDGKHKEGHKEIKQAVAELMDLLKRVPAHVRYQLQLAVTHTALAEAELNLGEWEEALKVIENAKRINDKLVDQSPMHHNALGVSDAVRAFKGVALTLKGLALAASDVDDLRDGAAAMETLEEAATWLGDENWYWLNAKAAAHAERGEFEEARSLQAQATSQAPPSVVKEMQRRLEMFEEGKPLRLAREQLVVDTNALRLNQ